MPWLTFPVTGSICPGFTDSCKQVQYLLPAKYPEGRSRVADNNVHAKTDNNKNTGVTLKFQFPLHLSMFAYLKHPAFISTPLYEITSFHLEVTHSFDIQEEIGQKYLGGQI